MLTKDHSLLCYSLIAILSYTLTFDPGMLGKRIIGVSCHSSGTQTGHEPVNSPSSASSSP